MISADNAWSRELWNSLLDADMNVRYWSEMCARYSRYDTWSRFFVAVTSSSTVAAWGFWNGIPWLWKGLSGASAVLAGFLSIVNLPKKVAHLSALVVRWKQAEIEYELLWTKDCALRTAPGQSKYKTLKEREAAGISSEQMVPPNHRLLTKCYGDVIRARGLARKEKAA